MMMNLVEMIGHRVGWAEGTSLETSTGCTAEMPDGTWLAWVVLDDPNLGLLGCGSSEGHALSALQEKLKALGSIANSAYAEAESRYRIRKQANDKAYADRLAELLGVPPEAAKPPGGN